MNDMRTRSGECVSPVVILAGYRFSGRSQVLQRLELAGYRCIDNLPPGLISGCLRERHRGSDQPLCAIAVDTEGRDGPEELCAVLEGLKKEGIPYRLVFMEAGDTALSERHAASDPAGPAFSPETLQGVRERMLPLRSRSDLVLDSSYASPLEERDRIIALTEGAPRRPDTVIEIISFGYRFGALAGDVSLDARFIPNPYYVPDLRPLDGRDAACAEYVLRQESARGALSALLSLVGAMLPAYSEQGRRTLRVAIGCTGGQHRSVALAEALAAALKERKCLARVSHREIGLGRHERQTE